MEAVGRLAGGVAHDLNNVLSVILSYRELMKDELPVGPMRDELEEIQKAGERASALTRQLLAFSRKQVLELRVLSPNEVVLGVEKMLRRTIGDDIELTTVLHPEAHSCNIDRGQFEQVLMNLVVNARDAMPQGGKLTVETYDVFLDDEYVVSHPESRTGPHVVLAVSDTGIGMDQATQSRIFEPFFTTKSTDRGTGLGLATVYGIVKQSLGSIWVYSEPGAGTTFKIYVPQTANQAQELVVAPTTAIDIRGSDTILLADDDAQVRTVTSSILRRAGYNVLDAGGGADALLLCEQYGARIGLLLTDVVMPRMSGRVLAERLQLLRPDMLVLYMSGYTDDAVVLHGVLQHGINYLQKPITPDSLLRKVRQVLDAKGSTSTHP